ncbi:hypothetical protein TrRE_jg1776, partial [Triparma retinervis]
RPTHDRRKALLSAFILLDSNQDKVIEKRDFLEAVMKVKDLDKGDKDELDFLWQQCDKNGDGEIDGHDFFSVCDILVCNVKEGEVSTHHVVPSPFDNDANITEEDVADFYATRKETTLWERFTAGGLVPVLRKSVLTKPFFPLTIILCILGSNVILIYAANSKLNGEPEPEFANEIEYAFVIIFMIELILKVLAVGLKGYLKTPWWTFDGILAIASLLGIILEQEDNFARLQQTSVPLRMAKVLRTIRLIRVVSRVKKFRMIISTSTKFFPSVPRFLLLLTAILYVYTVVGIEAFGMSRQEAWENATEGTSYSEMIYEKPKNGDDAEYAEMSYSKSVNFQNPQNTLITLFSLMMVNNWHIIHDAVEVAAGPESKWAVSLYFVSFHIIAVIVVMNLIVSTFLESYLKEWTKAKYHMQVRQEKRIPLIRAALAEDGVLQNGAEEERNPMKFEREKSESVGYDPEDDRNVLVCYTCEKPAHWWRRRLVECAVTRKMCCKNCCRLYVEPRLDGIRKEGVKALSLFSNQNVGYEPLRMEIGVREQLVAMWMEDQQYIDTIIGRRSNGGADKRPSEASGNGSVNSMSTNSIEMGKLNHAKIEKHKSKYYVKKQTTVKHWLDRDIEDEIGVAEGGGDKKEDEVIEEVAEELEQRANAIIAATTPRGKEAKKRRKSLTEALQEQYERAPEAGEHHLLPGEY